MLDLKGDTLILRQEHLWYDHLEAENNSQNRTHLPPQRPPPLDIELEVYSVLSVAFWIGGRVVLIHQLQPLLGLLTFTLKYSFTCSSPQNFWIAAK